MLNEIELAYWHAFNVQDPTIWENQSFIFDNLLLNAIDAKCLCNPPEVA